MRREQAAVQEDGPIQGRAEKDRNKKVGSMMREGDIVVASDSKSKLWKDMSLKREQYKIGT